MENCSSSHPLSNIRTPSAVTGCVSQIVIVDFFWVSVIIVNWY